MMKLNELKQQTNLGVFSGVFRLTGRIAAFDEEGVPYLKLRLSCCHADHVALVDLESTGVPEQIGHLELLEVVGDIHPGEKGDYPVLSSIKKAGQQTIEALPALHTLPRAYCPAPSSLDLLVKTVRSFESMHLQNFVSRVLERKGKLEVFLNAPASLNYHHSYRGGLLDHSLEVAKNAVSMMQLTEPDAPRLLKETCFIAGLLHDIGKTYTYDADGRPTRSFRLCEHDDLTLEACAFGLADLDQCEPEIAATLRHIWTCASSGARYGSPAALTLARYVRDADGQSAMSDNQRRAFRGRAFAGFGRVGNNIYWMPSVNPGRA